MTSTLAYYIETLITTVEHCLVQSQNKGMDFNEGKFFSNKQASLLHCNLNNRSKKLYSLNSWKVTDIEAGFDSDKRSSLFFRDIRV